MLGPYVNTIANPLQGTQGFVKTGPGSVILTADSSGLSGPILIADGALEIDGKLNGPVDIGREVVLAGVGQLGTTTLYPPPSSRRATTVRPSARFTINGNLNFGQNTIYRVHADPASTASDRIHVTGEATLDGTVEHIGPSGNYAPRTTYNILTADGGVQGRFTGASSSYAFLTPTLSYDPKNVHDADAQRRADRQHRRHGQREQRRRRAGQAGSALDRQRLVVRRQRPVRRRHRQRWRQRQHVEPGQRRQPGHASGPDHDPGPGALGPEAAVRRSLRQQRQRAAEPGRHRAHAVAGPPAATWTPMRAGRPTAQAGGAPSSDALPQSGAYPVWTQVVGNWSKFKGDGNAASVSQSSGGLRRRRHRNGKGWRVGGGWAIWTAATRSPTARRAPRSTATRRPSSAVATSPPARASCASWPARHTWHNIDAKRDVAAGTLNQQLKSSYRATSTQLYTELGYKPLGDAYSIEPYAGLAWNQLHARLGRSRRRRAERIGQHHDVASSTPARRMGVGAERSNRLTASVGWRHAWRPEAAPGTGAGRRQQLSVRRAHRAQRGGALGAEMAVARNTTVGVGYDAQFGGGNRQQSGQLKLAVRFKQTRFQAGTAWATDGPSARPSPALGLTPHHCAMNSAMVLVTRRNDSRWTRSSKP